MKGEMGEGDRDFYWGEGTESKTEVKEERKNNTKDD